MNAGESDPSHRATPEPYAESATLESLEAVIEQGLPHYEEVALAMLEIYERKLFKPASFKGYLKDRWKMSRSRGYQLLKFARLKKMSTVVGIPGVRNERQARALAPDGTAKPHQDRDSVGQAMQYLVLKFEKLPPDEKREFIDYIRQLLDEMEACLKRGTSR